MDGDYGVICHLQCEISSVSVTGLGSSGGGTGGGELFLRCHVPAGGGRAIQIDSRGAEHPGGGETADGAAVSWRDVASLSCDGSPACVRELVDQGSVVFEVRRRRGGRSRGMPLGRILGSELLGRSEVPWREGGGAVVERRVELAAPSSRQARGEAAAPVLSARMSVRLSETAALDSRRRVDSSTHPHRESGCEWSLGNEDVFAGVACAADDA
ncbi:hypothetical protein BS78_02G356300 [Paspalum vaginatum]|nr:hypothetical protein BS78_02G356300 [Paspalum vaginatum]